MTTGGGSESLPPLFLLPPKGGSRSAPPLFLSPDRPRPTPLVLALPGRLTLWNSKRICVGKLPVHLPPPPVPSLYRPFRAG